MEKMRLKEDEKMRYTAITEATKNIRVTAEEQFQNVT